MTHVNDYIKNGFNLVGSCDNDLNSDPEVIFEKVESDGKKTIASFDQITGTLNQSWVRV